MAKGGATRQKRDKSEKAIGAEVKNSLHDLSMPLRESLHQLANRLGLFPESDGLEDGGRFAAPVFLPANDSTPQTMQNLFSKDFAVLNRIGKPIDRCHAMAFQQHKLYCLPYYFYDGFNALLYLEHEGVFGAAWKEQECDDERSPLQVLTPGTLVEFQKMIQQVLEISNGI